MTEPSRQERFSGTKDVADALCFDVRRLESYLVERIDGSRGSIAGRPLAERARHFAQRAAADV